jgi:hypothetical protein
MTGSKAWHQRIAIFLIYLVILLPFYTSVAFAATIDYVEVYGKDSVPGFRARKDITVVNVTATIPEDKTISSNQIKILEDPTVGFTCKEASNTTPTFECIRKYPEVTLAPNVGVTSFSVQVFDDSGTAISPVKKGSVTVDSLPPKVHSVDYKARPGGVVIADFDVEDFACNAPVCTKRCIGISYVQFSVAGLSVGQNQSFGKDCRQTGELNLSGLVVCHNRHRSF